MRTEIDRLRDATSHCEELVAECIRNVEHSTTTVSDSTKEINKRLKVMARNIENSRCTHNEENHDFEQLIARYKSVVEHSGASSSNQIASLNDNNPT